MPWSHSIIARAIKERLWGHKVDVEHVWAQNPERSLLGCQKIFARSVTDME